MTPLWLPTTDKVKNDLQLRIETTRFEITQLEWKIASRKTENETVLAKISDLEMAVSNIKDVGLIISLDEYNTMKMNLTFFRAMVARNSNEIKEMEVGLGLAKSEVEDYLQMQKCEVVNLEEYKRAKKQTC